jgi:hypothetical protein
MANTKNGAFLNDAKVVAGLDPSANQVPVAVDVNGHLLIDIEASTITIGSVDLNDGAGNPIGSSGGALNENLVSISGASLTEGQKTMAASIPVVIASDQTPIPVTGTFTPPALQNVNLTQLDSVALGAPSNYGTSPGAVEVQGVNAFITNTPAVTLASTTITGNVTVVQPTGSNLHADIDNFPATQAVTQSTSPWVVSGTVTTTPPANASTNLTQVGGVAISEGQKLMASSFPVVIASDQSAIPVSGTITTSPNVNVHDGSGNTIASTGTSLNVDITNTVPVTLTSTTIAGNVTVVQPTGSNLHVDVDNFPATVAVTQSTSPWVVSGTVTTTPTSDLTPATQNITAQDTGTTTTTGANNQSIFTGTPTAGSAASFSVNTITSVDVQVTGTWTGTLEVESSSDGGTTWYKNGGHQKGVTFNSSSFTSNFQVSTNVAAATTFRVRAIAAWTGTATVRVVESINPDSLYILNALQILDGGTTGSKATIKAASTPSVATDTALVTTLIPTAPSLQNGLSITVKVVKASAGNLDGYYIYNPNASVAYVQIFNASSAGSVTLGTTVPVLSLGIPSLGAANISTLGIAFSTGIAVASTTTATGSTANGTAVDANFWFA